MKWGDVDFARDHVASGGGRPPSRKVIYNMVKDGMRVARLGDTGRHLMFSDEWIDEYLIRRSAVA